MPSFPAQSLVLPVAAVLLGGCSSQTAGNGDPSIPGQPPLTVPTLSRSVVLSGLSGPWDIAFTAEGAMLYTEKCRGLSVRLPDGAITRPFGTAGASLVAADLACEGQSGVHGVARMSCADPSCAWATQGMPSTQISSRQSLSFITI